MFLEQSGQPCTTQLMYPTNKQLNEGCPLCPESCSPSEARRIMLALIAKCYRSTVAIDAPLAVAPVLPHLVAWALGRV